MKAIVLLLLSVALLVSVVCPLISTADPRPRPVVRPWLGFHGPAYLPGRPPRRPRQRVLDSLARTARPRRAALPLVAKP